MFTSIRIEGYRGFEKFEMAGLGRVNLLVGNNNSGKTSVIEVVNLLASGGDPAALWQTMSRRGERLLDEREPRRQAELDVCHLFNGHEIHNGSKFSIAAKNDATDRSLVFTVGERPKDAKDGADDDDDPTIIGPRFALHLKGSPSPRTKSIPLTRRIGLSSSALDWSVRRDPRAKSDTNVQYVTSDSLSGVELTFLWERIALTRTEDLVLRALHFIDPKIERIASISNSRYFDYPMRGGFIIKRAGFEQPVPIGSMGDGIWRMLALAIAISRCKDGVLLIDEIDTGLHYTVMADLWRLIGETSQALNVQVFATTHSYDCVRSLAAICRPDAGAGSQITIQRVEPGKSKSVPFTEGEIKIAAERFIEVR